MDNNKQNKFPLIETTTSKISKKKGTKLNNKNNLLIDYNNNTSMNITNLRKNLPNIITSLTPIEKRNKYTKTLMISKNKKNNGNNNKGLSLSRNFGNNSLNKYNTENSFKSKIIRKKKYQNETFENDYFNDDNNKEKSVYLNNKNFDYNDNDIINKYIKNDENDSVGDSNLLAKKYNNHNNSRTKNNNLNKIKLEINKKNIIQKIKHPSKININTKKNFKYKLPLDMINNLNKNKKKINNGNISTNINNQNSKSQNETEILKSNSKKKGHKNRLSLAPTFNINDLAPENKINSNNSKNFIESCLITFNNLVSQAKELGHILIENKEMLKNKNYDFLDNEESDDLNESINNNNNINNIDRLNQEIQNEHKSVEQLQKINNELNNKINLFNDNAKLYENKVNELINVINQIKNNNNINIINNNSNSNGNSDNISNGLSNNSILTKNSNNNFTIEKKPKKKKYKFGFVELIFMKDDKFEIIQKKKPPQYEKSENKYFMIDKLKKDPKLVFVNVNKNKNKQKPNNDDYLDAATQMANHIIIESIQSLNEDDVINNFTFSIFNNFFKKIKNK